MSHLSKIKTVLTEAKWLTAALSDLDCDFTQAQERVQRGQEVIPVDVKVNKSPRVPISGEVGFVFECDHIESIGDWHGVDGAINRKFLEAVTQRYAYNVVKDQLALQGFRVDQETLENHGKEIHLLLRRSV